MNDVYYKIAIKENIIMTDYSFLEDLEVVVMIFLIIQLLLKILKIL